MTESCGHKLMYQFMTSNSMLGIKFSQPWPRASRLVNLTRVVSDSLRPRGLWPTRLLHPWDSPGKNTGVSCHFLPQGIFPTQVSCIGGRHFNLWATREDVHRGFGNLQDILGNLEGSKYTQGWAHMCQTVHTYPIKTWVGPNYSPLLISSLYTRRK